MHLADVRENYVDIAYTALVCEHGFVFEGRGTHKRPGANGSSELNGRDYAVCALLGARGLATPSDAMLHGLRDAVEWLRRDGDAGDWLGGHRDGYATECPGDQLYAWLRNGAPRPDGGSRDEGLGKDVYRVRPGDSLSVIARRLDVDWRELATVNGLRAPYTIYPGQELRIPGRPDGREAPAFPGAGAFVIGRSHAAVVTLDEGLIRRGWTRHHNGDGYQAGPRFTEYTRRNVADFQRSRVELRGDPDGYPGPLTWRLLLS
ncbi:peptidoglycan-binding protein [Streptomyces xinghaiensis]|uniref:peptidoglycan-binding protein n=1 Tax=Streptomyces xinghaiensis TaxID=1038928 RepID=UPI00378C41AD